MRNTITLIALTLSIILLGITCMLLTTRISNAEKTIETLDQQNQYIYQELEDLKPTQIERYFFAALEEEGLNGEITFIELGQLYYGEIEDWGYESYVLELEETIIVDITIRFSNTFIAFYDEEVNLNIYYGGFTDPDIQYENMEKTSTFTVALQEGFNTIEFDSYSDNSWDFTIIIEEK